MIPSDTRAHTRQMRWIELENVGSYIIPAYGACEVVDVYRPDDTFQPGGGREVWKVQFPSVDEPCNVVINGPCEIPVGGFGKPGTKDGPMRALVAQDYDAGTAVGVKKEHFELYDDRCGFVVDGDFIDSSMEVTPHENCPSWMMVEATVCIYPGGSGTAQPKVWSESANCWIDDDRDLVTVEDPFYWLLATPGDMFKVERTPCSGLTYHPAQPYGLQRRVKIESEIGCGECGNVTVIDWTNSETSCVLEVANRNHRKLACDATEYATLILQPGSICGEPAVECRGILIPNPRPLRARATLDEEMCNTGTVTISGITYLDVCVDEWSTRDPVTTANNYLGLLGCEGDTVELAWNEDSCGWDVIQVAHHSISPVMGLRCKPDGEYIQVKRAGPTIAAMQCQCEESDTWEDEIVLSEIDVVSGADFSCTGLGTGFGATCDAKLTTTRRKFLTCGAGEDGSDISLPTQTIKLTHDTYFRQDGDSLKLDNIQIPVCVFCATANETVDTDTVSGGDCVTGTGGTGGTGG